MRISQKISEQFAALLKFLRDKVNEYQHYSTMLDRAERQKNDWLHILELNSAGYQERCKTATRLRWCLLERRKYKDAVKVREPIATFLTAPEHKNLLDQLARVLGDVRKEERYQASRTYRPRVIHRTVPASAGEADNNENDESVK
jgi:hypothetical protein